jgi:phage-related protein
MEIYQFLIKNNMTKKEKLREIVLEEVSKVRKNLLDAPEKIGGEFSATRNQLTSLEGASSAKIVNNEIDNAFENLIKTIRKNNDDIFSGKGQIVRELGWTLDMISKKLGDKFRDFVRKKYNFNPF